MIAATGAEERTRNPFRPARLTDVIGQDLAKRLLTRAAQSAYERRLPMEHTLLVAPSGVGKSTLAHAAANDLGVRVFEVEAPVSYDTLLELRLTMNHGDVLLIDEIHQQGIMERRGRSTGTQPEVLYSIMEDRTMPTQDGVVPWPWITIIGATTDEGRLPDAFINRFALRPMLAPYTHAELSQIARYNADVVGLRHTWQAVDVFVRACRGIPRELNNLWRNAAVLNSPGATLNEAGALEVLTINGITRDGLTPDMQAMLRFLLRSPRKTGDGEVIYQASVNTIATAIGKSRDSKAVSLRVEPYLIEKGFVQVTPSGRRLTDLGEQRARALAPNSVRAER